MPPIQLYLYHSLKFLNRLRIIGEKLWKLGIQRVSFLQTHARKCLSLINSFFRNWNQIFQSSYSRLSIPYDKTSHHSHRVFDNVDCFNRLPNSLFSKWQSSPSLPLHHKHYLPDTQMRPSTSQAVVSYMTPPTARDDVSLSPLASSSASSSANTRAEDDHLPGLSEELPDLRLVGVTSSVFERYERNFRSKKVESPSFVIPPLFQMTFAEPKFPNGWVAHDHPDGTLYFFNNSREIPILTDVWLYDTACNERLETIIKQIFSYIDAYKIEIPEESCLVLEFRNSGNCGYYFVDHATQRLFWLDDYEAMEFLFEVKVEYTPSLVGHQMKSLYWCHNHLFPNIRPLSSSAISEIKDILTHAIGDSLTSDQNLAPYKLDVLQKMLDLVNEAQEQDKSAAGSVAIISRFLQNFYRERFLHLHGQKMARLNRNQSIHPDRSRTLLMTIISPFLLYGPEAHLRKLQEITVDSLVNQDLWKDTLNQLIDEWKEFTLYATVLLNANVAFLAIQSVDSSGYVGQRSNAQRASYFSMVNSIGAIVLGLLLVRGHNTSLNSMRFLLVRLDRVPSMHGLETLALMYGLPYALLLWGMVAFLIAFSFMCFDSRDQVVITILSIAWFALCTLLLWWISVLYEGRSFSHLSPQWLTFRHFKDSIKKWIIDRKAKGTITSMHMADNDTQSTL